MRPRTSVVVLSHNRKRQLGENLDELLRILGRADQELIVVDNASTDGTREMLQDVSLDHPRLRLVLNDVNKGVGAGRNDGLRASRGRFVVCLDDDALINPSDLDQVARAFHTNSAAGILTFRVRHPLFGHWECDHGTERKTVANYHGCAHAFRAELFDEVGYLDDMCTYGGEELDYSIRAHAAGFTTLYVPEIVVDHAKDLLKSMDRSRRLSTVFNYVRVLHKHFPSSTAGTFSARFALRHALAAIRKKQVGAAMQLPVDFLRGRLIGRATYQEVPPSTIAFFNDMNLRPDFGNGPLLARYREISAIRTSVSVGTPGDAESR